MRNEITIPEIALSEDLKADTVRRLSREKGFPEPLRKIGPSLLFDIRAVNSFFREREKKSRKFKLRRKSA